MSLVAAVSRELTAGRLPLGWSYQVAPWGAIGIVSTRWQVWATPGFASDESHLNERRVPVEISELAGYREYPRFPNLGYVLPKAEPAYWYALMSHLARHLDQNTLGTFPEVPWALLVSEDQDPSEAAGPGAAEALAAARAGNHGPADETPEDTPEKADAPARVGRPISLKELVIMAEEAHSLAVDGTLVYPSCALEEGDPVMTLVLEHAGEVIVSPENFVQAEVHEPGHEVTLWLRVQEIEVAYEVIFLGVFAPEVGQAVAA